MDNFKEYNIGLDIGVGSVGWAITDKNGELIKRQNKNLWGSRIFNEANTAAKRRMFRSTRRRIERRKERINMLQSLLLDDMEQLYPNFFPRLRNSSLVYSDKDKNIFDRNYNLFDEEYLNDEDYYARFPTIYHLRHELVNNPAKQDFRMVYLALHHIIKYRGNFLYEGDFSNNPEEVKASLKLLFEYIQTTFDIRTADETFESILAILKNNETTKKEKEEKLKGYFLYDNKNKNVVSNLIQAIIGKKFELSKIFELDDETKISFASDITDEDSIIENLRENVEVYEAMKNIYSWFILQSIINVKEGEPANISYSFIKKYEKHKKDLKTLKEIYKKYYPLEYDDMFRKNLPDNYVSFRGKALKEQELAKCKQEDFYKKIEKKIKELPDTYALKEAILNDIQNDNFLRKLNTTDNGAIPHQLHLKELEKIIDNQSKYYNTLAENKDKIISIFTFRIPYYVGPLTKNPDGKISWLIRKNNEKIRPWNIDEIIDKDLTAEEFIIKMTNKCTYLLGEDVMPKCSLLYSKFCVLNELNNISIISNDRNNAKLDKKTKQGIINDVFMKYKSVNKKHIVDYLKTHHIPCETISGLQDNNNFMSNLSSYIDMKNIFADSYTIRNEEMYEKLIYWITIFEDKKILKDKIKKEYNLPNDIIKKLVQLKYSGWSRISKQLLIGEKSNNGESIMEILEHSSMNFMQIINDSKLGFDKIIEKQLSEFDSNKINYKKDIETMPTSPANKRAIWQTVQIVEELTKVMKHPPQKIYIEFARNEEEKKLKDKRAATLLKKYNEFTERNREVYEELKRVQNDKNISEKMYLYFMQNGQCMYSGETLHLDELNLYEVDHILPQSYIKDDSLDNKALVKRERNQRKQDSLLLEDSIIDARTSYWKMLLDNGLISQTKFYRLTRRRMLETDTQKLEFVNRQLVETRQITKYVTNLLKKHYADTEIYAIRAGVVTDIRQKFNFYKNRNVNDYHHAHDAYLLCVVGNIIENNLKYKDEYLYGEYVKKYFKENKGKDTTKREYGILVGLVSKHIDASKIRKVLAYKDCYLSRMLEEGTGEFYNQTLQKKNAGLIPKKANLPTEIYGGYTNENKAYMCTYKYKNNRGKQEYDLIGIPIKFAKLIKDNKLTLEEYIKEYSLKNKKYTDLQIIRSKVLLYQQYIDANNIIFKLCSDKEIREEKPLILSQNLNKFVKLINSNHNKLNEDDKKYLTLNYISAYKELLNILNKEYPVFNTIYNNLKNKEKQYEKLEEENKKIVINEIIKLMNTSQGNLKLLGLADRAGRMKMAKRDLLDITFIDKSITGIYERRYKIDGLENGTSK